MSFLLILMFALGSVYTKALIRIPHISVSGRGKHIFHAISTSDGRWGSILPECSSPTVNQLTPVPQSVFFQIGSATLPQNSTVNLQQIANLVKDNPGIKLKVTGYADSDTGSASWNKQLSEDRANTVANELVKLGVNKSNMIISGMGGVNTLTPPAFNRRVIIEAQ